MTDIRVDAFSTIVLPETLGLRRVPVIPAEDRPENHDARYDALGLVHDVVHVAGAGVVRLYCPPPLDLGVAFREGAFRLDGRPTALRRLRRWRRYAVAELAAPARPERLSLAFRGWEVEVPVQSDADCAAFAGRNVLVTLSKDNALDWVRDWARFHAGEHGADAVLFLDNGSDAYGPEALAETLGAVPGIEVVRVARIDRPYGPMPLRGSKSRAMFLQTPLLNLARVRWLWRARAALQIDVDELVVGRDGRSVFDATVASRAGWIKFRGLWRTPVDDPEAPVHADHWGVLDDGKPCPAKYCIVPAGRMRRHSWNVHNLDLVPFSRRFESADFHYLHCRGITTRWKREHSRQALGERPADEAARDLLARALR